ncbi:hypothetical protein GGC64_001973 [Mycobacterium sp. OAS707]|uniref:hypothetical protein n=1 Tax=Mycobacterium sp. OAS707 TaxID=2663822 RepID=UPI00178AD334|nr:hypothetical protein [Mycobacterium sp. OAS707]MBE1547965.1 hypothetical protein [Mycobacterium sp. OAS707]
MGAEIGGFTRCRRPAAVGTFAGFGLSTGLLFFASLAATPAMVAADGPVAWGAIALGQSVGAVSSLVVGYGWAMSGPSKIARANLSERLKEYEDSVRVKLALLLPGSACAALVAAVLTPSHAAFAVAGAISTTIVALTSNWYFAGLMRPYLCLVLETLPRVAGTVAGIVLMILGYSAIIGLAFTSIGMITAFLVVTIWVYRSAGQAGVDRTPREKLARVLASRRHGIASMVGTQVFFSLPLAIISVFSPAAQPVFALADRVRQLVSAGFSPVVVVYQGWVPSGADHGVEKRSRTALIATFALAVLFASMFLPIGPTLMHQLGAGQIAVPQSVLILTALVISFDLFNSVLAFAVMPSLDRLEIVTRATATSVLVMLPITLVGTLRFGATGALAGVICGLVVRIAIEIAGATAPTRAQKRERFHDGIR